MAIRYSTKIPALVWRDFKTNHCYRVSHVKAHAVTCVMYNGFFEQERAFVLALHDRIANIPQLMPVSLLGNALQMVQRAKLRELQAPAPGFRR